MRTRRILGLALIIPIGMFLSFAANLSKGSETAKKFGVHEISLNASGSFGNPFDVICKVTFKSPSGANKTVEAFNDGGNTWKARCYVNQTGNWKWSSQSSVAGLGGKSGSFNAGGSSLPGMIMKDPNSRTTLMTENGQWFSCIGDTGYFMLGNTRLGGDGNLNNTVYRSYVQKAKSKGFNFIRANLFGGLRGEAHKTTTDKTEISLPNIQNQDGKLSWILNTHPDVGLQVIIWAESSSGIAPDLRTRFLRQMTARWGAFPNITWMVMNDSSYGGATSKMVEVTFNYLIANSPFNQLRTTGARRNKGAPYAEDKRVQFLHFETYDAVDADETAKGWNLGKFPWCGEDRYSTYKAPKDKVYFFRRLMWAWIMSGGSACYGGDWDNAGSLHFTGTDSIRHINSYFKSRGINMGHFTEADGIGKNLNNTGKVDRLQVARRGNAEFLFYHPNSTGGGGANMSAAGTNAKCTLNLPAGNFSVEWYNPKSGSKVNGKNISGGKVVTLTSPFSGDAVGRLSNGSTPPPPPPPEPQPNPEPKPQPKPEPKPQPTPEPQPTPGSGAHSLVGTRTAATTIQLSWKAPKGNPALKEYGIVLGPNNSSWRRIKTVSGTTTSTTLTGITAGVAKLQIRAILKDGKKLPFSEQISVAPFGGKPEPKPQPKPEPQPEPAPPAGNKKGASDLVGTRTAATTIQLTWKAPAGNPELKEYGIVLGPNNSSWIRIKTVNGTTTSVTLTDSDGIKVAEAKLQVRAVLKDGTKLPMSEQIKVLPSGNKPEPTPQPQPQPEPTPPTGGGKGASDLVGTRTAATTIELSWKAPAGNPDLKEYGIVLGSNNSSWKRIKTVGGTTTSTTLTGITTGTAKLQVRAILKDGTKLPMSEQISVAPFNGPGEPAPEPKPQPKPEPQPEPTPDPVPPPPPGGNSGERSRVVVLTDIGVKNDAKDGDDIQTLVRFLAYSNEFDVEGLVATMAWKGSQSNTSTFPQTIHAAISAYGKVYGNLKNHDPRYPDPGKLSAVVKAGKDTNQKFWGGDHMKIVLAGNGSSAASKHIISVLKKNDPRPVWFLGWGKVIDLAAAVYEINKTESASVRDKLFSKIRVYDIAGQCNSGAYITRNFPNIYYMRNVRGYQGVSVGGDMSMMNAGWIDKNIRNGHGALGSFYPSVKASKKVIEGDTPSVLWLIPNGINNTMDRTAGSWGGTFGAGKSKNRGRSSVRPSEKRFEPFALYAEIGGNAAIGKWRKDYQNDFAARMDWCVKPFSGANHNPRINVNGNTGHGYMTVKSGTTLNASATKDPDGDSLSFKWLVGGGVAGTGPTFKASGKAKILLEVSDNGTPPLKTWKRIIVN